MTHWFTCYLEAVQHFVNQIGSLNNGLSPSLVWSNCTNSPHHLTTDKGFLGRMCAEWPHRRSSQSHVHCRKDLCTCSAYSRSTQRSTQKVREDDEIQLTQCPRQLVLVWQWCAQAPNWRDGFHHLKPYTMPPYTTWSLTLKACGVNFIHYISWNIKLGI